MPKRRSLEVMAMLAHFETERAKIALAQALGCEYQAKTAFDSTSETVLRFDASGKRGGMYASTGRYVDVLYEYRDHVQESLDVAVQSSLDAQFSYKQQVQVENSLERVMAKKAQVQRRKRERKEVVDMIEIFQAISESEEIARVVG